jgi:hypothetical protein
MAGADAVCEAVAREPMAMQSSAGKRSFEANRKNGKSEDIGFTSSNGVRRQFWSGSNVFAFFTEV